MITIFSILFVLVVIGLVVYLHLHISWENFQEGTVVYRCDPDMKNCHKYRVVVLSDHKYLADINQRGPYMKYDFCNYLEDRRNHRVLTEEHVDSFD